MDKVRILFLAANPNTTDPLAIDEEIRAIEQRIRASDYRDSLVLIPKLAARPDDIMQAMLEHKPQVIHFSGHGSEAHEILLVGNDGDEKPVSADALRALFTTLKDNVRVVMFNACFARGQAEAVAEVIDCAIGMNDEISDKAAITFSGSFYRALGFGRSVQDAFDQGKVSMMLEGVEEEHIPELLVRNGVNAADVVLVKPDADHGASPDSGSRIISIGGDASGNVIISGDGNQVSHTKHPPQK